VAEIASKLPPARSESELSKLEMLLQTFLRHFPENARDPWIQRRQLFSSLVRDGCLKDSLIAPREYQFVEMSTH